MPHTVLRSIGGALQIIGVASIVLELHLARRQLGVGSPSWLPRLRRMGDRVMSMVGRRRARTITGQGAVTTAPVTCSMDARVIKSLEGKTVDVQIGILASRIEEIWRALPQKIEDEASLRATADEQEALARIEATKKVLNAMQDSALGGFRIRGYGAVLIIVGTALVTWG